MIKYSGTAQSHQPEAIVDLYWSQARPLASELRVFEPISCYDTLRQLKHTLKKHDGTVKLESRSAGLLAQRLQASVGLPKSTRARLNLAQLL